MGGAKAGHLTQGLTKTIKLLHNLAVQFDGIYA